MQKDEVVADAKTFETILYGTTRWGNFDEALKIVKNVFNLEQHGNPRGIIGFQMDTRNFRNLWNAMKELGEFNVR